MCETIQRTMGNEEHIPFPPSYRGTRGVHL